jgi:hypothetical protein
MLRARFLRPSERIPSTADAILFETNLRSFYFSQRSTIKVLGPHRSLQQFQQDVQTRCRLSEIGLLRVPQVLAANFEGAHPYAMDELLAGYHPRLKGELAPIFDRLLPMIWSSYHSFGFGRTSEFSGIDVDLIEESFERAPIPPEQHLENECRTEILGRLRSLRNFAGSLFLTSFGHGDLTLRNIVVTDSQEIYLIDWELAGYMPVAWDFRKIMLGIPSILPQVIGRIREEMVLRGWQNMLPANHQCLLAMCARLAERARVAADAVSLPQTEVTELQRSRFFADLKRIGEPLKAGIFD